MMGCRVTVAALPVHADRRIHCARKSYTANPHLPSPTQFLFFYLKKNRWQDHFIKYLPGVFRDFDLLILVQLALAVVATYLCKYETGGEADSYI